MVCKLPYESKYLVLISNFFQLEIELYCGKHLRTHFDQVETRRENNILRYQCFSRDCSISDLLFTNLWTLSTAFVLIYVKTGFDAPILNYILPFLYQSGVISIIYYKYGKSFIEIIPLPVLYYEKQYLEIIF